MLFQVTEKFFVFNYGVFDDFRQTAAEFFRRQGLQRRARFDRGEDESRYLNPLSDMIDRKENRAGALLKQFGNGKFDAQRLFDTCRLIPY